MTPNQQAPASRNRLDGGDLRSMFSAATALFESNVEAINALNVFPVPDGDTGTNMFLTLQAVVDKAGGVSSSSAGEVAGAMATGALMGARGNSGVILSQFFRGIAVGLDSQSDFGTADLARAFREAREHAYKSVGNPVEGTLLTVISSVADAAERASVDGANVNEFYDAICKSARESVALTPTMLPVLREAGVVDAGGQGLSVVLEGARRWVNGEEPAAAEVDVPEPVGVESGAKGSVSEKFLEATEEELYGYCTQFMIEGEGLALDSIREEMEELAGSTVVVGDPTMVKIHVHAEDPGRVLSAGVAHGALSQIRIQNMDEQHAEFSVARREEARSALLAVVAVASGNGLKEVFSNLGASKIVIGGDTMNPSVQDLVDAVESAPSENVIILPNNKNIVACATQAAGVSDKSVKVVPTNSAPQGIAAMLSLNLEQDQDANVASMEQAAGSVRTAEITEAVRSATVNDVTVEPGQLIGLLEHQLVAAGQELPAVAASLLKEAEVSERDLVTLYWGDRLAGGDAEAVLSQVSEAFPGVEFELVEGGQPHYHFIISIE